MRRRLLVRCRLLLLLLWCLQLLGLLVQACRGALLSAGSFLSLGQLELTVKVPFGAVLRLFLFGLWSKFRVDDIHIIPIFSFAFVVDILHHNAFIVTVPKDPHIIPRAG